MKSNEHNKASIKEIKLAYKRLQDHVVGFIHDCYIIDAEGSVPTEKVKTRYDAYCRENALTPLSSNALGAKLIDAGLEHRRTRSITKGKLVPVYAGIREREGQKLC